MQTIPPTPPESMAHEPQLELSALFPAVPNSVAAARRFVAASLRRVKLGPDAVADAALLVSELVTNALTHARSSVRVRVRVDDRLVRIDVFDSAAAPVTLQPLDPVADSGRGLRIVDALATDWNAVERPGGKTVWFELRRDG
jgi:anti-sigma regulatory factor (Ser/Thr protein kinase)